MFNHKLITISILCVFIFGNLTIFSGGNEVESSDTVKHMVFTHGNLNSSDFSCIRVTACSSIKITVHENISSNDKLPITNENNGGPDLSIEYSLAWISPSVESKPEWRNVACSVWRICNIGDPYFFEEGDVSIYTYHVYPDREVESPLVLHLEEGQYIPTGEILQMGIYNPGKETPIAIRLEIHSTLPEQNFDNNVKTDYFTLRGVAIEGHLYKVRSDGEKVPIYGKLIYSNSDVLGYNELDPFIRGYGSLEDGWYKLVPPKNPDNERFSYTVTVALHFNVKEITKKTPPLGEFESLYMDIFLRESKDGNNDTDWDYPFELPFWTVGERKIFQYRVVNNDSVPWEDVVVRVGTPYDFWFDGKLWLSSLNQYDASPEPVWQRDHPDRFDMVGHNRTTIIWRFDRLNPGESRVLNFSVRLTYYRPVKPYPSDIVTLPPEYYENCSDNVHPAEPIYPIAEVTVDVEGVKILDNEGNIDDIGSSSSTSGGVSVGSPFDMSHRFQFWPLNPSFDITVDKWMKLESHDFHGDSYGPLKVRKRVSTFSSINETVRFYIGFYPTVDSNSVSIQDYSVRDYLPPFLEYKSSTVPPSSIIKNSSGTYLIWNFSDTSGVEQANKNGWFYYNATVKGSGVIDKCSAVVDVHRMWISGIGGVAGADVPAVSNYDWVSISTLHPIFTLIDFSPKVLVVDPSDKDKDGCVSAVVVVSRVLPDTSGESVYYIFEEDYDWLDIIPCNGELSYVGDDEDVLFVVNVSRIPDLVGSDIGSSNDEETTSDEFVVSHVFSDITLHASVGFSSDNEEHDSIGEIPSEDEHPADDDVPSHAPIEFTLNNALSIVFENLSSTSSSSGTLK